MPNNYEYEFDQAFFDYICSTVVSKQKLLKIYPRKKINKPGDLLEQPITSFNTIPATSTYPDDKESLK